MSTCYKTYLLPLKVLSISVLCLIAACSPSESWRLTNISGLMPNLDFNLVNTEGKTVTGKDFEGKVTLLFFGYTHCEDVCPTRLMYLTTALKNAGISAQNARVLFVTVDPKRDTLERLKTFSQAFGPSVIGLRPDSEKELNALTKRYRVSYGYGTHTHDSHDKVEHYEVSHSSAVYIFDQQQQPRLLNQPTDKTEDLVHDLKQLLVPS